MNEFFSLIIIYNFDPRCQHSSATQIMPWLFVHSINAFDILLNSWKTHKFTFFVRTNILVFIYFDVSKAFNIFHLFHTWFNYMCKINLFFFIFSINRLPRCTEALGFAFLSWKSIGKLFIFDNIYHFNWVWSSWRPFRFEPIYIFF